MLGYAEGWSGYIHDGDGMGLVVPLPRKAGDEAHVPAREDMKGRWRHPIKSMSGYSDVKQRFAKLPER